MAFLKDVWVVSSYNGTLYKLEDDIILLHDCYKSSIEAAFRIIDLLKAEGYEFVTADKLLLN